MWLFGSSCLSWSPSWALLALFPLVLDQTGLTGQSDRSDRFYQGTSRLNRFCSLIFGRSHKRMNVCHCCCRTLLQWLLIFFLILIVAIFFTYWLNKFSKTMSTNSCLFQFVLIIYEIWELSINVLKQEVNDPKIATRVFQLLNWQFEQIVIVIGKNTRHNNPLKGRTHGP